MKTILTRTVFMSLLLMLAFSSYASHYRYGNITWRVISGQTVEFTVTTAWRSDAIDQVSINYGASVTGASQTSNVIVSNLNGVGTRVQKFVATYPGVGPYNVTWSSCCRIGGLANAGSSMSLFTTVNMSGGNQNSPVSSLPPIVNIPKSASVVTFQVPANDLDGDALTYRLATTTELNGTQPPGMTINAQTGLVSVNTSLANYSAGQLWFAGIVISDGKASIFTDFLISITQPSTPPQFIYGPTPSNGSIIQVSPGQNVNFQVSAQDVDAGGTIASLFVSGKPAAATFATASGNPATSTFNWTPTAGDFGSYVLNFIAQDNVGVQTSTSVIVQVSLKPQFDVPPTPEQGMHNIFTPGQTISFTVSASDPDPLDVVRIIDVKGKNMMAQEIPLYANAGFSPLPSVAANPTSGTFSWTTQASDWGHKHVYFWAEDSYGDKTRHEVSILINTNPVFTSAPPSGNVSVGQSYTYNISATDADIPYGDVLQLYAPGKPAWLSFTDNGNGIAVLSGTPGLSDVGTYTFNIEAQDINHHHNHGGMPMQMISITVTPCALALTAVVNTPSCSGLSDGSIDLSVTGANLPLSYIWSNNASSEDLSGLNSGSFTVTVSDAYSCTATATFVVGAAVDNIPPVITCAPAVVAYTSSASCDANVSVPAPVVSDNCSALNNAMAFDGINDRLLLPNPLSNPSFTIETWFRTSANSLTGSYAFEGNGLIWSDVGGPANDFVLAILNNRVSFWDGNSSVNISSSSTVNNGNWQHVALVRQAGGQLRMYLNGVLQASGNAGSAPINANPNISIGGNILDNRYFRGEVDETRLWNVALSQAQILANMNARINTPFPAGLVSYFNYDQGTANGNNTAINTIQNQTGGANAAIVNMAMTASLSNLVNGAPAFNSLPSLLNSFNNTSSASGIYPLGTTSLTWTAMDASGNTSSCQQQVTVIDNIAPVITVPANISVYASSANGAVVNYSLPTATDNCSATVSMTAGLASGSVFPIGTTTVTYQAADASGNTAQASFTVEVSGIAPVITGPGNIAVNTDANTCGALVSYTAVDNVGIPASVITYSIAPGSYFSTGTAVVTATATNPVGTSSVSFTVTVTDVEAPVAIAQNITVQLDATGNVSITPAQVDNGSNDACGIASVVVVPNAFTCANVGNNVVVLTVADVNGNISTANAVVTVQDNVAPVAIAQNITLQLDATGNVSITAAQLDNGSNDACGIASVVVVPNAFTCANVGNNAVVLTVTDVNGNISTANAVVTVEDNIAPIVSCQPAIFHCYNPSQIYSIPQLVATDNCSFSVAYSVSGATLRSGTGNDAGGLFNVGTSVVTWTVTDASGNISYCSIEVVINPELTASIPNVNVIGNGAQPNVIYIGYGPTSLTYTAMPVGGTAPYTYLWSKAGITTKTLTVNAAGTYTVTVTDSKGCTTTASFAVEVVNITCGKNKVYVCQVPPGNPANAHTICISVNAVPAHLAIGNYLGSCKSSNRGVEQDVELTAELTAYPNPFSDFINIEYLTPQNGNVRVDIYDITGKLIRNLYDGYAESGMTYSSGFQSEELINGIYLVRLTTPSGVYNHKIVLAR